MSFEYLWVDSYLNTNYTFWLDGAVSWEDVFDVTLSEIIVFNSLFTSFFSSSKFFLDSHVKLSFLDLIMLSNFNYSKDSLNLYYYFLWEISFLINIKYLYTQFLFYTDYQDFIVILLYYSPELILSLIEFLTVFDSYNIFSYNISSWSDLYNDSLYSSFSEFFEYFILLFYYFWIIVFFLNIFRIQKFGNMVDFFFLRFLYYFNSLAFELRFHFEGILQVTFFIFFYSTMAVATFDDDSEEFLEFFSVGFFYFFLFVLFFFIYKYSKHYFSFLEMSVSEGKVVSFITKQFVRDMTNTFALFLRFFLLLFRANIYDGLDDILDSYYIFLGDFDEDELLDFTFFSFFNLLFYESDIHDDSAFSLEEENEFFFDIFNIYFTVWGKFFFFCFFILEEIFRIALAFYIVYLIIFDVHAVNCSYIEDNFFFDKKINFISKKYSLFN